MVPPDPATDRTTFFLGAPPSWAKDSQVRRRRVQGTPTRNGSTVNTTETADPDGRDTEYFTAFCSGALMEAVWWEARPTPGDLDTAPGREWEDVEVLDLTLESLPAEQGRQLLAAAIRFVDAHPELAAFDLDPVDVGSAWWMAHRGPDGMPGLDFRTFKAAIPPGAPGPHERPRPAGPLPVRLRGAGRGHRQGALHLINTLACVREG